MNKPAAIDLNVRPSLGYWFYRVVSCISLLALLAVAHSSAKAQQLPVVSCASPEWIFNTGVNATTGAQLAQNASEPRWQYASHPVEDTDNYIPPAAWQTPVVKRLATNPWRWTNQSTADWITPNTGFNATKYTYYRFRFDLDIAQDPAAFQLGVNFEADDQVVSVFVNGAKVNDAPVGGGFLPPDAAAQRYTRPSQYTIGRGWQVGTNEIVLLVTNTGGSTLTTARPYGGVVLQGLAMCGGARISKAFSPVQVQSGGTSTLTIHVDNLTVPARPVHDLLIRDDLPAPLEIAGPITTTCLNATPSGTTGDNRVMLERASDAPATADMLPTGGCDITVPVRWPIAAVAQCVGNSVTNTITPGSQFSTSLGFDPAPANASLQCMPLPLVLSVQTLGASGGPFNYTLIGTGQATGNASTVAPGTPAQVDGNTAAAGIQSFAVTPGVDLIITQSSLPAGWLLTGAVCTRDGVPVGSLTGDTYTVAAAEVHGAGLACTFDNVAPGSLRVGKLISGGTPTALSTLDGAINLSITCNTGFTTSADLVIVNGVPSQATVAGIPAGSVCTVSEAAVPAAPSGFEWDLPGVTYVGNPAAVAPGAQAEVVITNPLRTQAITPVPTQSWPLLMLMALGVLTLGGTRVMRRG